METNKFINFFIKRYTDCGHKLIKHSIKDNIHIFIFFDESLNREFERRKSYEEIKEIYSLFN